MRRVSEVLAFVVCIVLVGVVGMVTRAEGTVTRWYDGDVGEVVVSPDMDIQVRDVKVARAVVVDEEEFTTPGVYVVVEWSVAAKRQAASFSKVQLVTADGTSYGQREEFLSDAGIRRTSPGFTATGTSVFQLMPEQLDGVELRIERSQGLLYTHGAGVRVRGLIASDAMVRDVVTLQEQTVEVTQ